MSTIQTNRIQHSSGVGNNIVLSDTGDTQVNSLNSGQLAGFRNQLINDFRIWQRGESVVYGASAGGYTADRWAVGANTTTSQRVKYGGVPVAELLGSMYMFQSVELNPGNLNTPFSVGSQWTLSYYATKAPDGSISNLARFRDNALDGTDATNPVTIADITTPTPTGETLGSGNELVRYSTTFTVTGTPAVTNRSAVFHITGDSDDVDFAYAQLEPGPIATPFEIRPISIELAMCQRYFISYNGNQYAKLMHFIKSRTPEGGHGYINICLPVTLRVTPTITDANNLSFISGAGFDLANVVMIRQQNNIVSLDYQGSTNIADGTAWGSDFVQTNSVSARLSFDAEL